MNLSNVFDAISTHATAAAAGVDAHWTDIAIAPPLPRGKCVRIYYGGERPTAHFGQDRVLNGKLVAQSVIVRAFWPVADYALARRKILMLEMAAFTKDLHTRLLGDSQLGGEATDLAILDTTTDDILFGTAHYAITETECVIEYDELPLAP